MTRVVIADDATLIRAGVARFLSDAGFDVVGEAADAPTALELIGSLVPDVAVLDVRMPPTHTDDGLRVAEAAMLQYPTVGLLILSQYIETHATLRLLEQRTRGVGYLLKDRITELDSLVDAVRRVAAGESIVDQLVAEALLARRRTPDALAQLSERELEVLHLMAQGRSNMGIVADLHLSSRTVESHVRSIFRKLDLSETPDDHRRVLAVIALLRSV